MTSYFRDVQIQGWQWLPNFLAIWIALLPLKGVTLLFSLGFLVLAPVVTASIYTAYRDVFLAADARRFCRPTRGLRLTREASLPVRRLDDVVGELANHVIAR